MNEERILDRLEELNEFIENFPDSELTPIARKEAEYLKSLL